MSGEAGQPGPTGPQGPQGDSAVNLTINSSNGVVYRDKTISTVLNVIIFKGDTTITNLVELQTEFGNTAQLHWYKKTSNDNDFVEILTGDNNFIIGNGGFTLTVNLSNTTGNVVFQCQIQTVDN